MKNKIVLLISAVVLVILVIFGWNYVNKVEIPTVGPDGKISGNYTIEGVMKLKKPYVCTFEKTDQISKIAGVMHTDGEKIYEEFRIRTESMQEKKIFDSFQIIKDGKAYTWTSLQNNIGYISSAAKSASRNASPQEQAQIVGTRDEMDYKCEPWKEPDQTIFELPGGITFSELKK